MRKFREHHTTYGKRQIHKQEINGERYGGATWFHLLRLADEKSAPDFRKLNSQKRKHDEEMAKYQKAMQTTPQSR